jgi:hypothetical protein
LVTRCARLAGYSMPWNLSCAGLFERHGYSFCWRPSRITMPPHSPLRGAVSNINVAGALPWRPWVHRAVALVSQAHQSWWIRCATDAPCRHSDVFQRLLDGLEQSLQAMGGPVSNQPTLIGKGPSTSFPMNPRRIHINEFLSWIDRKHFKIWFDDSCQRGGERRLGCGSGKWSGPPSEESGWLTLAAENGPHSNQNTTYYSVIEVALQEKSNTERARFHVRRV